MKRNWGFVASLLAVGTTVGGVLPACTDNDQSIFIQGAIAPPTTRQGSTCTYTADPQQPQLFSGSMDVGLTDTYFAVLLVGNQLVSRGDSNRNRAETSRLHITEGVIRVTERNGTLIHEFSAAATGFNDPQNNNTPGYSSVGLVVINSEAAQKIADSANPPLSRGVARTVLANIKVFGTTLGGKDVESGEFQFPIAVCNGCLVDFSKGFDPEKPPGNCSLPAEDSSGSSSDGPCRMGQDIPIDCRQCRGLPVCGS